MSKHCVTSEEELREVIGSPNPVVESKVMKVLDQTACEFIANAPLVMMATVGPDGGVDVSPKGDSPGFVRVDSPTQLVIPDRPGNKMALGFSNLLANPEIGLIFVMPDMGETLRVKGRATISRDPALLESFAVENKPAILCTVVEVYESMLHCGKAMIRSKLWQPETWTNERQSFLATQMTKKLDLAQDQEPVVIDMIEQTYRDELY